MHITVVWLINYDKYIHLENDRLSSKLCIQIFLQKIEDLI